MIVCTRCSNENQDHYKFCLVCGAPLPKADESPVKSTTDAPAAEGEANGGSSGTDRPSSGNGKGDAEGLASTQMGSSQGKVEATAGDPSQTATGASADRVPCPSCGTENPGHFRFCGNCGLSLNEEENKASPSAGARASLVLIRPDGTEGQTIGLEDGDTVLGRDSASTSSGESLSDDLFLSPKHAKFSLSEGELTVTDQNSLNGVYVRIDAKVPYEIDDKTVFRIGQEVLRYEAFQNLGGVVQGTKVLGSPSKDYVGRVALVISPDTVGNAYCVPKDGLHFGRERGEVVFPDDGYVSGLHCRVYVENDSVFLMDEGSSNGTFLKIRGSHKLRPGDLLLMGQQLFRVQF